MTEIKNIGVDLGRGLKLKNRVLVASGTFAYGKEASPLLNLKKLGGIVTKAISKEPRYGNKPERIVEVMGGMLNAIGLQNVGMKKFVLEKLPFLRETGASIIVNVVGWKIQDFVDVVKFLNDYEGIGGYEINLSCPNVEELGATFCDDSRTVKKITSALRKTTKRHLMIKLSPNTNRISNEAKIAEGEGADSLSVINTVVAMAVNVWNRKPKIKNITGGLSGPAIKPIALAKVYECYKAVKIPVVGIGGMMNTQDVFEFFLAGAQAVQIGTANFIYPNISERIADEIPSLAEKLKVEDLKKYIGTLQT